VALSVALKFLSDTLAHKNSVGEARLNLHG
jgi:hypothetical protein